MIDTYQDFLRAKVKLAPSWGREVTAGDINPALLPHQRDIVAWAVAGGRRGIFTAFGLGKTVIQLETVRLTLAALESAEGAGERRGRALIVCPLGVRQEFVRDAREILGWSTAEAISRDSAAPNAGEAFGITGATPLIPKFIRSIAEVDDVHTIYLTNYETVRDGRLDPAEFDVASLDEASILRGFGGTKTFRECMRLFTGDGGPTGNHRQDGKTVPYRFVATATPSPNEYIELLAYAEFLGIMDVSQAKTRFFKRDSTKADKLTLHAHKQNEFWMWVASWAIFVQKPSDLCRCSCHTERNFRANGSESSLSNHGSMVLGSADVTAELLSACHQIDCYEALSSVADVSDRNTAGKARAATSSGAESLIAARGQATKTGKTTEAAESGSLTAGATSEPLSPTWGNQSPQKQSIASTTLGTTSPETVDGDRAKNRRGTHGETSCSRSKEEPKAFQPGRRKPALATGNSTAGISSAGTRLESCRTCCDRCRCDEGYALPPISVHWHEVPTDHSSAGHDRSGQARMFRDAAIGVQDAAAEKRDSLPARIAKMQELRALDPSAHRILWHDLEAERAAIEAAVPDAVSVYGAQDLEEREQAIIDFSDGRFRELAAKPVIAGSGCNFQRHCAWAIFLGIGFKFNDFIQAIHRIQRFLQTRPVRIDLIYTEAEREVRKQLERKWRQHNEMVSNMTDIIREYGLSHAAMAQHLTRKMGVERVEVLGIEVEKGRGPAYRLVNEDCVLETSRMAEASVGLVLTSIPFSTQYEYSPNYADFGHSEGNAEFFQQMDYLTPQLLRVLMPGRIAAIHVKDRIVPGGMTGLGFQTVYPFHVRCIEHYTQHGFAYMGMKTIVTDVVRENNQTYRLGWTEQCKDGTKMGVGMPEYLLLFRKPPSQSVNSYADLPVVKHKTRYTRSRWQVDAHGFTRSAGNRLLTPEELRDLPHDQIFRLFRDYSLHNVYDFEHHVKLGEALEAEGRLPVTFMLLQPQSWAPDVWTDITRMLTLNSAQSAKGKEMHLCPMQFDLADRVIEQFSMPGETVLDPFGGLMTVPYRAIRQRRVGVGIELNPAYFLDGCSYCRAAAEEMAMPTLFDVGAYEASAQEADEAIAGVEEKAS